MSSERQREKIPHNYSPTEDDLVLPRSLFRPTRTRESTLANANNSILSLRKIHQGAEYFELSVSLYQPRKTIRVVSKILTNPTLRYFLSLTLKLVSNQLHPSSSNWCQGSHSKGTLIEFLSRIILTQRLPHGDQSIGVWTPSLYCVTKTQASDPENSEPSK